MSATSFEDAKARTQDAQASLDALNAEKRRASLKDPTGNDQEYRAKAQGRRWIGANAFDAIAKPFRR